MQQLYHFCTFLIDLQEQLASTRCIILCGWQLFAIRGISAGQCGHLKSNSFLSKGSSFI